MSKGERKALKDKILKEKNVKTQKKERMYTQKRDKKRM